MRVFIILIGFLTFFTCKKDTSKLNENIKTDTAQEISIVRITKKEVEDINYIEYGLSSTSKKRVSNWASYGELESQILSIKNGDLSYFKGDEKIIGALLKDLKATIPKNIFSESIMSRITAIETKLYKLKSAVKINQTPKNELLQSIKEFFVAFSNLNLQMNKKFEKEAQDISKSGL